ncbi:MAG TPA: hypothetical protein VGD49_13440, partial [Longimicrobiales bacterium]
MKPRIFAARVVHTLSDYARGNAVLTIDGRVQRVGVLGDLRHAHRDAEVIDFGNAFITPGLTDAHI